MAALEDRTEGNCYRSAVGRLLRRHRLQPLHPEGVDITRSGCGLVSLGHGHWLDGTLYTTDWYTPELEAFTLTGMAQANIRALESNASANASLRCELARVDDDGTNPTVWASWCCAPTGTDNGELTTSEVARTINVSGDDLAFTDGQRLRIRIYLDDISSAAMANAFNVQPFFNGTSAAASGDTYVTLAQSSTSSRVQRGSSSTIPCECCKPSTAVTCTEMRSARLTRTQRWHRPVIVRPRKPPPRQWVPSPVRSLGRSIERLTLEQRS